MHKRVEYVLTEEQYKALMYKVDWAYNCARDGRDVSCGADDKDTVIQLQRNVIQSTMETLGDIRRIISA